MLCHSEVMQLAEFPQSRDVTQPRVAQITGRILGATNLPQDMKDFPRMQNSNLGIQDRLQRPLSAGS